MTPRRISVFVHVCSNCHLAHTDILEALRCDIDHLGEEHTRAALRELTSDNAAAEKLMKAALDIRTRPISKIRATTEILKAQP